MNIRRIALCGAIALLAAVGTAQPNRDGRGAAPGPDPERLKAELGVDDAQLEGLRKLQAERRDQAIRHRAELRVVRLELDELLGADTVDEKAVLAKAEQLSALQGTALRDLVKSRMAVRRILSADQARVLEQLTGRRPERPGRGPRDGSPGGPGEGEPEPPSTPQRR